MGRSRPRTGRNLDTRSALRSASLPRPGKRSSKRDLDLARARAVTRRCANGLPPDTPSPGLAPGALASAESFAGDHPAAQETLAAGRRALDAIGAPDYAHLELDLNGLMGRSVAGQLEEARAPAEDALRRARTLANPSQLIVALRWFAGTRRADETDETIQALEECLAHSRAVATPDAPDVLQPLGLLAKLRARRREHAAPPSRRYAKGSSVPTTADSVSHVGLRAQLRCQRRRRSRRSGARGDARRCRHRRVSRGPDPPDERHSARRPSSSTRPRPSPTRPRSLRRGATRPASPCPTTGSSSTPSPSSTDSSRTACRWQASNTPTSYRKTCPWSGSCADLAMATNPHAESSKGWMDGGGDRNRTGVQGFAAPILT